MYFQASYCVKGQSYSGKVHVFSVESRPTRFFFDSENDIHRKLEKFN